VNALEEVPIDSELWRERYGLWQVHSQICKEMNHEHKKPNKSTNTKATVLPPGSLGSYLRGPSPIASGDGCKRSCSGKARSCPCAPASVAEVPQGKEALRRCNQPPRALTCPPPLGECAGRSPNRFRTVAGVIEWRVTCTYLQNRINIPIIYPPPCTSFSFEM
jgi:hypothetical protein